MAKSSVSESSKRAERYRDLSLRYAEHTATESVHLKKFKISHRRELLKENQPIVVRPHSWATTKQIKLATKLMQKLGDFPSRQWLARMTVGEMDSFIRKLDFRLKKQKVFLDPLGLKKAASEQQPGSSKLLPHTQPSDRPRIENEPAVSGNAN